MVPHLGAAKKTARSSPKPRFKRAPRSALTPASRQAHLAARFGGPKTRAKAVPAAQPSAPSRATTPPRPVGSAPSQRDLRHPPGRQLSAQRRTPPVPGFRALLPPGPSPRGVPAPPAPSALPLPAPRGSPREPRVPSSPPRGGPHRGPPAPRPRRRPGPGPTGGGRRQRAERGHAQGTAQPCPPGRCRAPAHAAALTWLANSLRCAMPAGRRCPAPLSSPHGAAPLTAARARGSPHRPRGHRPSPARALPQGPRRP